MKHENLIELYYDGVLDKTGESELFTILAGNPDIREYFNLRHRLNKAVENSMDVFPQHLEENIFHTLPVKNSYSWRHRIFLPLAYSAAAIFFFISIFLYNSAEYHKQQATDAMRLANFQGKTLELLYNSLPAAQITGEDKSGIIIKSQL